MTFIAIKIKEMSENIPILQINAHFALIVFKKLPILPKCDP